MTPAPFYRRLWRLELLPRPPAVESDDLRLTDALDRTWAEAARRAGGWLLCRKGCTECCVGPFPITQLDAWRLRRGLEALSRQDPARAEAVRNRAREQARSLAADFPGDPVTGALDETDGSEAEERFAKRHGALPCPALDPITGGCDVYVARPVSCRTYGPPVQIAGEALAPCRLCFAGASHAATDACRVEPDAEGLEARLLDELEAAGLTSRHTIVAFALAVAESP